MSNSSAPVIRLLGEQRKRCLATILTAAETAGWWHKLNPDQQQTFREQVRTALSVFYDLTRDVVKVSEDDAGIVRNEYALDLLQSIHTRVETLNRTP